MEVTEEVFPQVVMDIGIGQHVNDFDVDLGAITQHLREHNLTDDEISSLKIHFRDKQPKRTGHLDGKHGRFSNRIDVYIRTQFAAHDQFQEWFNEHDANEDLIDFSREVSNKRLNEGFNETLYHELEHAIVKAEGGMPEARRHLIKSAGRTSLKGLGISAAAVAGSEVAGLIVSEQVLPFIGYVLSGAGVVLIGLQFNKDRRKDYKADPEEIRCRTAEQSSGLVSLEYKVKAPQATS